MQVTPRNKQTGRRSKRSEVRVLQADPVVVMLSEDEKRRRFYNRGW